MRNFIWLFIYELLFINISQSQNIQNGALEKWIGTYSGTLPCSDCKEMQYIISLNADRSFVEEIKFVGKSDKIETSKGKFSVSGNGIMNLVRTNEGQKFFRRHPEGLHMLDENAKLRTDKSIYSLKEVKYISNKRSISEKYLNGTDFYAFGDSLQWMLDWNFSEKIRFINRKNDTINALISKPDTSINFVFQFKAKVDSIDLNIFIRKDSSRNEVSGERFNYRITIETKTPNNPKTTLKGVGRFLPDQRLNQKWEIVSVKGKDLKGKDFSTGFPTLTLNTASNNINGFLSCNSISGVLGSEANSIFIHAELINNSKCDNSKTENDIFKILQSKELAYSFSGNILQLYEFKKLVMELQSAR